MIKLIIAFLFTAKICFAQQVVFPVDSLTGKVMFTEIVKVDSVSAIELFKRSRAWFTETYKSSKDVIQDADNETHTISGKAVIIAHWRALGVTSVWGSVNYYISIICKDGKYKYIITDFYHDAGTLGGIGLITNDGWKTTPYAKKHYDLVIEETNNNIHALIISLKEYMKKTLPSNSEW